MPKFVPFRALRFAPSQPLDKVIAPPYDVLSASDVDALAAGDVHNIVHIDMPLGGEERYDIAAQILRQWIAKGVLVADADPSFTIYRMRFVDETGTDREIVGVLGGLEVVDEGAGGVLPHERTTPKASTDRLDLTRATNANLSPVWGLSLAHGLTDALREPAEPVGSLTVDGVEHTVERVTDPERVHAISTVIDSDDVLIADGHHRYGVAQKYREEVRARTGARDTAAEQTLTFVQELSDDLSIDAIHRLYSGIEFEQLREDLAKSFDIEPTDDPTPSTLLEMVRLGRLVLLARDGSASWLIPKEGIFDDVRALDGAWLEHALAGSEAVVSYQHGLAEVRQALADGHAKAAVLIRPTSITEIERTARERLLMPPKSTFFTPKLRTGLVIRDLT